ncbi:MAG: response regulator [Bacteroidota bacterium]
MAKSKVRVLLADQDEVNNFILANHIKTHRLAVQHQHVNSARKGLTYLDKVDREKPHAFPEVIIWDRDLRDMDGFAFLEIFAAEYHEKYPKTRVFLVSKALQTEDKVTARNYPFVGHLISKPVSIAALSELIRQGKQFRSGNS